MARDTLTSMDMLDNFLIQIVRHFPWDLFSWAKELTLTDQRAFILDVLQLDFCSRSIGPEVARKPVTRENASRESSPLKPDTWRGRHAAIGRDSRTWTARCPVVCRAVFTGGVGTVSALHERIDRVREQHG